MPPALYEHLITTGLSELISAHAPEFVEHVDLEEADAPLWLARHVGAEVFRALSALRGPLAPSRQIELANRILTLLSAEEGGATLADQVVVQPGRLLQSIHQGAPPLRTQAPFAVSTLLTRARGEAALGFELGREISNASSIDALVAFVTLGGFRCLQPAFEAHAAAGRPLRLLTTTYMGATEADAVDAIANLPHAEVRISFDARRTRLHAKAWLFSRPNQLDTGYVGSANLSRAALFGGHEWMVKVAQADLPHVLDKFRGAFETLWEEGEFERYDPSDEAQRRRLREALQFEQGGDRTRSLGRAFFTLKAYPFQQEILERLQAEREVHGRWRNLVVAATGTGKTVVAAFDYQRQIGPSQLRPRLLFLAHREELLRQARDTFRHLLRDEAFGELLTGASEPLGHDHLFATIQSFRSRGLLKQCGGDYWNYVVVDECHHVTAESYQAIVPALRPRILLGLTATPERSDGAPLLPDFDGHIAAEVRLWHALERQLLAPFELLRARRWH